MSNKNRIDQDKLPNPVSNDNDLHIKDEVYDEKDPGHNEKSRDNHSSHNEKKKSDLEEPHETEHNIDTDLPIDETEILEDLEELESDDHDDMVDPDVVTDYEIEDMPDPNAPEMEIPVDENQPEITDTDERYPDYDEEPSGDLFPSDESEILDGVNEENIFPSEEGNKEDIKLHSDTTYSYQSYDRFREMSHPQEGACCPIEYKNIYM